MTTAKTEAEEKLGAVEVKVALRHITWPKEQLPRVDVAYCGVVHTFTRKMPDGVGPEHYCPECWAYYCGMAGIKMPRKDPA